MGFSVQRSLTYLYCAVMALVVAIYWFCSVRGRGVVGWPYDVRVGRLGGVVWVATWLGGELVVA